MANIFLNIFKWTQGDWRSNPLRCFLEIFAWFLSIGCSFTMMLRGFKKQQPRALSDFCWNHAVNDWVLGFADRFDIQCEAKGKNLASEQLYNRYKNV